MLYVTWFYLLSREAKGCHEPAGIRDVGRAFALPHGPNREKLVAATAAEVSPETVYPRKAARVEPPLED
jgi:hypothetical protein